MNELVSSNSAILSASTPWKVFLTNPQTFDWTSFLFGGAIGSFLGAFIILFLERFLNWIFERRNRERQELEINTALDIELDHNLALAEAIIESLKDVHHSVFNFARFETTWLNKYLESCTNYLTKSGIKTYSLLNGAKSLMNQIQDISHGQQLLSSSSRALTSFETLAYNNNQNMLAQSKELVEIIRKIKVTIIEAKIISDKTDDITFLKKKTRKKVKKLLQEYLKIF